MVLSLSLAFLGAAVLASDLTLAGVERAWSKASAAIGNAARARAVADSEKERHKNNNEPSQEEKNSCQI